MLAPLLSIFILIASGYFAKKIKIFEQKHTSIFIDYVLWFAIPALIFDKIYHISIDTALVNIIIIGLTSSLLGGVAAFALCRAFKFSLATTVSAMLLAMFGNTIFIGMPIITGFYGEEALNEIIFYDQFATAIPISIIGPFILSFGANTKVSLVQNTLKILKFPPFIALMLGFLLKELYIPQAVFDTLKLFGDSVVPVALFSIGIGLGFKSIKSSYKSTAVVLISKMLIAPFIFILISFIFGLDFNQTLIIGILQCAMPPMVLASAMIMRANLDSQLAVSAVAMGVVFSFISLPLVYFVCENL